MMWYKYNKGRVGALYPTVHSARPYRCIRSDIAPRTSLDGLYSLIGGLRDTLMGGSGCVLKYAYK